MIVYKNGGYETNSLFPNTNFSSHPDNEVLIIDETIDQAKVGQVQKNYPYYDLVLDGAGKPVDISFFQPIQVTVDKLSIFADSTDTATITATIDDPTSTEVVNFYVNGTLVSSENAVNGVAEIQINATQTGTITIEAESTTKYGRNSITIQAVSV